jgi:hypothetical protein
MTSTSKIFMCATAAAAFWGALSWNEAGLVRNGVFSEAQARVGRPLTPMSYAGVARRTTRRAVYGTAAATAAAGAYAATPGCVQVTNAYGQVVTRC